MQSYGIPIKPAETVISVPQVVQLLVLWALFLVFQMAKSKYGNCTKEYLILFLAQTVFCISVTTFFIRRELADVGKPAAQQHGDPEMHQLLLGQRNDSPDSEALLPLQWLSPLLIALWSSLSCFWCISLCRIYCVQLVYR